MRRPALIALMSVLLIAAIVGFLLWDRGGPDDGSELGGSEVVEGSDPDLDPSPEAGTADPATIAEETATEEEEEADPELGPALLSGYVRGEGQGLPGANVILFAVAEIEKIPPRLEKLIPTGGGIPNIASLIESIKKEIFRFRDTAKVFETDAEGRYEVRGIDEGAYFCLTVADGWLFKYGDVASLSKSRESTLNFDLDRGASLGGRVVNSAGNGLAGVRVIAEYRPPGMPGVGKLARRLLRMVNGEFLKGPFESVSDASGAFTIDSLPAGLYDLTAYSEKGMENTLENVQTGTDSAVILFGEGGSVSGVVLDTDNWPVETSIKLEPVAQQIQLPLPVAAFNDVANLVNRFLGDPARTTPTSSRGQFLFRHLSAGKYKLTVDQPGYYPYAQILELEWGDRLELEVIRLSKGRTIRGIVRSTEGEPLADASILVTASNPGFLSAGAAMKDFMTSRLQGRSEEDGTFAISGLGRGKYDVNVGLKGYGSDKKKELEGGNEEPVEFVLEPGWTLTGIVTLEGSDEPVVGARVSARDVSTQSDEEGRFVLEGVPKNQGASVQFGSGGPFGGPGGDRGGRRGDSPEGTLTVRAHRKGMIRAKEYVLTENIEKEEIALEMRTAPSVKGVVLDPDGSPAAGTLVRLTPSFPEEFERFGMFDTSLIFFGVAVTGLDGTFELKDFFVPGGDSDRFRLVADHVLYPRGKSEDFSLGELEADEEGVQIQLIRGATVRGTVTDGKDPVPGASVRMRQPIQDERANMFFTMLGLPKGGDVVHANQEGQYVMRNVVPGDYVMSAEMTGFSEAEEQPLTIEVGAETTLDFVLDPGGVIAGLVQDDLGQPVADANVRVIRTDSGNEDMVRAQRFLGGSLKNTMTDGDGRYEILGLAPGVYQVIAKKAGFSEAEARDIAVDSKVPALVLVAAARLVGVVSDGATGAPVTSFRVAVYQESGGNSERGAWGKRPRSIDDTRGRFERADLAPGEYTVDISATGFIPISEKVRLDPGATREAQFSLVRAGRLIGRVVDVASGQGISGAEVAIAKGNPGANAESESTEDAEDENRRASDPADDDRRALRTFFEQRMLGERAKTDGDGYFELDSIPDGPQTIVVNHRDYMQTVESGIEVPTGDVLEKNFRLDLGLTISGTVVREDGRPREGQFVFIRGNGKSNRSFSKSTSASADGTFAIGGLREGSYRVLAPRRGGTGGEPIDVQLTKDLDRVEIVVPN